MLEMVSLAMGWFNFRFVARLSIKHYNINKPSTESRKWFRFKNETRNCKKT